MCVSRCLQCVGLSLIPMAIICMLSNILLLLPELKPHFLLEGHVTREATWATGLWGSGFLVRSSGSCVSLGCFHSGLSQGPLCLYNSSSGLTWGVPLQHSGYLYNQTLWSGVCLAPHSVVQWNVVLFSIMGITSALQAALSPSYGLLDCSICY
uniref:Uncharacterized protein n=1 Tax=Cyprinodon variegatus TaxID=28743 RepID=A0A3Q2EBK7_CYPVA